MKSEKCILPEGIVWAEKLDGQINRKAAGASSGAPHLSCPHIPKVSLALMFLQNHLPALQRFLSLNNLT